MPIHKSSDYKLPAVKYYLSHSKNQVQTWTKMVIFSYYLSSPIQSPYKVDLQSPFHHLNNEH